VVKIESFFHLNLVLRLEQQLLKTEVLTAYFPFIRRAPHRKRRLKQFFVAAGTSSLPRNHRGIHRHTRPTILLLLHAFVATGTCLPSRCLAMKIGIHFTESLPSNDRRDTDIQTDGMDFRGTPLRWAQVL
jgi:hypothetical protein